MRHHNTTAADFDYYNGDTTTAAYDAQQTGNLYSENGIVGRMGFWIDGYVILAASKSEALNAVKHLKASNIKPEFEV